MEYNSVEDAQNDLKKLNNSIMYEKEVGVRFSEQTHVLPFVTLCVSHVPLETEITKVQEIFVGYKHFRGPIDKETEKHKGYVDIMQPNSLFLTWEIWKVS